MYSRDTWICLALVTTVAFTALLGCELTPMDVLVPNRAPSVSISASPIRDSTNIFIATFNWYASDQDGEVVLFRYAVDDTSTADAWFETDDFELTLLFTAPDSAHVDSIYIAAATVPLERYIFNGAHTFFIKAVDDDGAESIPAYLSFTAETIAPETTILNPSPTGIVNLGSTFTITWEGTDLDGTEDPVGYSWRLVQAQNIISMTDVQIEATLLDPTSNGEPWSPFEPRLSTQMRDLTAPGQFIFGVRSIDQSGAIEPRMRTFRAPGTPNVLLIRSEAEGGQPRLEVSSSIKTTSFPTGDVRQKTFQIPANADVLFTWEADASFYGGSVVGYSYGTDLIDLEENNPGWAPESSSLTQVRLRFNIPESSPVEEHTFFVRARDDVGTVVIADIQLTVVPLQFERDILYIDDWGQDDRGRTYPEIGPKCQSVSMGGTIPDDRIISSGDIPQDICHDGYIQDSIDTALDALGNTDWVVDRYEPLNPVSGRTLRGGVEIDSVSTDYWVYTGVITLEQLARYKLVIWNTKTSANNALKKMNTEREDNFLAVYLEAGGNVWLTGTGVFVRTVYGEGNVPSLSPFGFEPRDFPYRFLGVQSVFEGAFCINGCFRQSGGTARYRRENGFEGAYPSPTGIAEGFPRLRVSRPPIANNPIMGISGCDAMVVPMGLDINPRLSLFGARLDTIYYYESNYRLEVVPPGTSWMDDGATGLRYSGPALGRLMMFGFPFFYLPEDQMDGMLVAGIRWLLEE